MSESRRTERELFPGSGATIGTRSRRGDLASDKIRTDFQRDVHRIIYSQAFRRLRHKTQVFFFPRNDHVCTRMEHVLHVASAARTVARSLDLNEDLAEAIGLAHDIGHAPFGHEGESILNEIIAKDEALHAVMPEFSHEINSLRVVDKIAKLDREPPGLKLTWEVRDGIVSHCGEDRSTRTLKPHEGDKDLDNIKRREDAGNPATLEGCIVRLIDKIVYVGRDIEDAITTEVISPEEIPKDIFAALGSNNGQIVGAFLEDMVENSGQEHISISEVKAELLHELIAFNIEHIYHSEAAERNKKQARHALKFLFDELTQLVTSTRRFTENGNKAKLLRATNVCKVLKQFITENMKGRYGKKDPDSLIVLDFIAGMTDNFAVSAYIELSVPQATV
jgi:dGTPase